MVILSKKHENNASCQRNASNGGLLRNTDNKANADQLLFENFKDSRAEIHKISQRLESGQGINKVMDKLGDENFVYSMLNDIGKLVLHDLNYMMKSVAGPDWVDIKPTEFGIELYKPEGLNSEYITGEYSKEKKRCSINLDLFKKIFLKSEVGQSITISEKSILEFLEAVYSTMMHEGFHAVQDNRFGYIDQIKNLDNSNDSIIFTEGSARFVEFFADSLITIGRYTRLDCSNAIEKSFLWHFAVEPVSSLAYERPDLIRNGIKEFIPYNIGMFIFVTRYVANGSFIETLGEIRKMAENGNISNDKLYDMLDNEIKNGSISKLKQKISLDYIRS